MSLSISLGHQNGGNILVKLAAEMAGRGATIIIALLAT